MEKQIVESRKVQAKYHEKKEKSIKKEEDFPSKQVSEESEKSCLTDEEELEEGEIRSDQSSNKRRGEATTTIACESRKVQSKYHEKKEKSINKKDYFSSNQVSEESEKSCLTDKEEELEEGEIRSDHNSKKRRREATTAIACESKKRTKLNHKPSEESRYDDTTSFDDWLFGTINHQKNGTSYKKAAAKIGEDDKDVINTKLQRSSGAFVAFPRAQYLSHVGIFSLPYTVIF
ncbi:unnamed protein product [Microthlaspi erraticum]|uniref:Uncharacterized protein n=1 Tax=Microthlaspi erraticum TaxID=1685480 RepID=A0A6D2JNF9_9BRAS|nr:unnamed protein product [Microthlaspi erraticum]CAA7042537.1 unnamed protein product [Microthlaspi erraticum]